MRQLLCILLICACPALAQDKPPSGGWTQKRTMPKWARLEFANLGLDRNYAITYQMYPFYFRGDFNGDGRGDVAFLIESKSGKKSGIIIIHGKWPQKRNAQYFILGAGKQFGTAGDNLKWIDVWSFVREGKASDMLERGNLPSLHGDAIKVEKREGKQGLIYWDGKSYSWLKL